MFMNSYLSLPGIKQKNHQSYCQVLLITNYEFIYLNTNLVHVISSYWLLNVYVIFYNTAINNTAIAVNDIMSLVL